MSALDHGMLNLPLAKRGDIDAQIDAYKARQEADAKAIRALEQTAKRKAKAVLAELLDSDLPTINAARLGCTRAALVATLSDLAKWQPAKLLKVAAAWRAA